MKRIMILLLITTSSLALAFEFEIEFDKKVSLTHKRVIQDSAKMLKDGLKKVDFHSLIYSFPVINCLSKAEGDHTGLTTRDDIIQYLSTLKIKAKIKTYFTLSRRTTAKRDGNRIYFAKHKMKRGNKAIANSLFHELLHVAKFGHCNKNSRNHQTENTIPYLLGDYIEELL